MHAPVLRKSSRKKALPNSPQETFNKYRRKIDNLRVQAERLKKDYDEALDVYHAVIKPKERQVGELAVSFTLKILDLSRPSKALNKGEREILQVVLKDSVSTAATLLPSNALPDEVAELFRKYFEDNRTLFQEQLSNLQDLLREQGLKNMGLSNLHPDNIDEDIAIKLKQSFETAKERMPPPPPPKPKTKKEQLKEQQALELESLQNKGLNSIYKRLVKELHPDLEQDANKKAEKETLMKRLTVAYEKQDLIDLLDLESKCVGSSTSNFSEENLRAYNLLLKDQINDLKDSLEMIHFHPRYSAIMTLIEDHWKTPLVAMGLALKECDSLIDDYSERLHDLSGPNALKNLKQNLAATPLRSTLEDLFSDDDLADFLESFFVRE